MKHRPGVEQFQIGFESAATSLERAEDEHPAGVVEQQIILCLADEGGDVAHQCGVGYDDVGDGFY